MNAGAEISVDRVGCMVEEAGAEAVTEKVTSLEFLFTECYKSAEQNRKSL